ncbi:hypothetical protein [Hymenobacter properus]|uniref:Uncharacterized protein n=1 Tax=Hymenobacter properus TaxID=2791026 RepID=A0A931FKU5_9BACT|nr:hypothetical protein [Hymenobacter properus]MBF9142095.1 hypothetical protein [Hymenobacter properus]MBR7720902.1 hypothetical protein [Microvirga sp. SRT04]
MNSYFILWPTDWCKRLVQVNDYGPFEVVYGGPHTSVPSLGKVAAGDFIYPVSIKNGELFILGRMQVERITEADVYLKEQNIIRPYGEMWDTLATELLKTRPDLGLRIPRTCIDNVATGNGTKFRFDFSVPTEVADKLLLGPKAGQEKGLSKSKDGKLSHVALQGHYRRLSADSAAIVADLMQTF